MSMPSSRAFVLTTPMMVRSRRPFSICRLKFGQVAASVARHVVVVADFRAELVLEVLREHFHGQPARGEGDGLYLVAHEVAHHVAGRGQGRLAYAQLPVYDGRIVEDEGLGRPRGAALVDEDDLFFDEVFRVLLGVCHRCGTADKDGVLSVEAGNPFSRRNTFVTWLPNTPR